MDYLFKGGNEPVCALVSEEKSNSLEDSNGKIWDEEKINNYLEEFEVEISQDSIEEFLEEPSQEETNIFERFFRSVGNAIKNLF